jgi:hypothetical protein
MEILRSLSSVTLMADIVLPKAFTSAQGTLETNRMLNTLQRD